MANETQEIQEKIPYISKEDFKTSEYNPYANSTIPIVAKMEYVWYETIIKPSIRNKSRLVSKNVDEAMNIFIRYDDKTGLEMIAGNVNLSENLRKIADMQIDSLESNKFKAFSLKFTPIIRGRQIHEGRDPSVADLNYHGGCYTG